MYRITENVYRITENVYRITENVHRITENVHRIKNIFYRDEEKVYLNKDKTYHEAEKIYREAEGNVPIKDILSLSRTILSVTRIKYLKLSSGNLVLYTWSTVMLKIMEVLCQ